MHSKKSEQLIIIWNGQSTFIYNISWAYLHHVIKMFANFHINWTSFDWVLGFFSPFGLLFLVESLPLVITSNISVLPIYISTCTSNALILPIYISTSDVLILPILIGIFDTSVLLIYIGTFDTSDTSVLPAHTSTLDMYFLSICLIVVFYPFLLLFCFLDITSIVIS